MREIHDGVMKSLVSGRLHRFPALAFSAKKVGKSIAVNARVWGQVEDN
jgi:hypothetical protein